MGTVANATFRHALGTICDEARSRTLIRRADRGIEALGDIINLRTERKRIARQLAEREAAANRLLHGRSRAERELESARRQKIHRDLDQRRIETGDEG
jgi:hypothetical protein